MDIVEHIKTDLQEASEPKNIANLQRFFKTGVGGYAEGDVFIGVKVPDQRIIVKKYIASISLGEIEMLLHSSVHEHRLTALFLLVGKFQQAKSTQEHTDIFNLYDRNTQFCNNWDLVDSSAHHIAGAYAYLTNTDFLYEMTCSDSLWRNRIAMVATLYFIRKRQVEIVYQIAKLLLSHKHDLMHKAVGWMLREAGKVHHDSLYSFLREHYPDIHRTSLRYAIEKFDSDERLEIMRGDFRC